MMLADSGPNGNPTISIVGGCQHSHPRDFEKLAIELGDVLWYVAVAANAIGKTLSEIAAMNVEKLDRRYPRGFDPERSQNRAESP